MVMLTFETFLLLLLSGLLGLAVGSLLGCGGLDWSSDRPWLRDGRSAPPAPLLPTAPTLLSTEERARLAASLGEAKSASAKSTEPVAASTVAAAAAEPVTVVPSPVPPVVAEAPAAAPLDASAEAAQPEAVPMPDVAPTPEPAPASSTSTSPAYALPPEIAAAAVTPTVAAEDASRAAAADAVGARPLALAAPLGGKPDDLKRVRGIGPQNERKLHGLGVYHFSQIAAWTAENARWAGSFMAFPGRIEREDWIAQATVLATGADTEFSRRVDAGEVPTSQSSGKA